MDKTITNSIIRKAAYAILSAALGYLVVKGKITQDNADQLATTAVELISAILLAVASAKTHRGSDDRTTKQDLDKAVAQAREEANNSQAATLEDFLANIRKAADKLTDAAQSTGGVYPNGAE